MFLNEKIRMARNEKGFTQKELADELTRLGRKTSNTAIANWESGLNSPDVDTLELICKILGKDGNYFFNSSNDTLNDVRMASYNGVDVEGLSENEIEEVKQFVEFVRNRNKK